MKTTSTLPSLFGASTFVLLISGVLLPEVISFFRSDYSSIANYISELGAKEADYALVINIFGFLPTALCSAIALMCLWGLPFVNNMAKAGLVLWGIGLSVGYLGAFVFPCDYGCPFEGSSRQLIHNLFGLVAYPVGTLGLLLLAKGLKKNSINVASKLVFMVAILTAIGFVMMLHPEQADIRGFWQRLADYSMFILIVSLGRLMSHPAKA